MNSPALRTLTFSALLCLSLGACAHDKTKLAGAPGCPDKDDSNAMAGRKVSEGEMGDSKLVRVVNAYCPIAGTHRAGENKMQTADLTRRWKGQTVGFCCDGCPPVWDAMSDADRQKALDAVMAQEKSQGM